MLIRPVGFALKSCVNEHDAMLTQCGGFGEKYVQKQKSDKGRVLLNKNKIRFED